MQISSKTNSCGLIIKTFALFTIILSTNGALGISNQPSDNTKKPEISKTLVNSKPDSANKSQTSKTIVDSKKEMIPSTTNDNTGSYQMMTEVELQALVDQLPEKDRAIIRNIQDKIVNWPEEIFKEVRSYNEFIILVTNQAKERYNKLSSAAKQALEAEKALKESLSSDALKTLSTIHVENAY